MPFDAAFLAELKRGDDSAVERLVAEFEGPLYRYFFAIHGDPALAGEQSADAFADLVAAAPRMRGGPAQLRGFVYAVARNVERRRWRDRWRRSQPLAAAGEPENDSAGPGHEAQARDELRQTLRVLGGMDATTRDIFVLAFVEQLPLGEVAQTLGLPLGTVKSRIHRGRQELTATLASIEDRT
ncbi:RNA polymerase sigma factor [Botrimarina sp.]|uniref:RNA polymerase sigma factor n=1 Tax=Botrimarina sp. TaxID=2795802 RepID=UPI0032EF2660